MNALLTDLNAAGLVDEMVNTELVYKHRDNAFAAAAQVVGGKVRITVYRNAFASGPAALYSTLRHELIHVAQRLQVPDEDHADAGDDYMLEDTTTTDIGQATAGTTQIQLQEIETHCWELEHANETGIAGAYLAQTVTDVSDYATNLTNSIAALPISTLMYWRGYMVRAVATLRAAAVAGHTSPANAVILNGLANNLAAAYQARDAHIALYNQGLADARAQLAAQQADLNYMAGFDEYGLGQTEAANGAPELDNTGKKAHWAAYYDAGLARAQINNVNDRPDEYGYDKGFNEYRQGLTDIQGGVAAANANIAYMAARNEYTQGLTDIQGGVAAANANIAYMAARNQYTQGLTDIQGGAGAANANVAYMAARNQYTQGLTDIQGGAGAANANAAYMTARNEYTQGLAHAQAGAAAANANAAYMAARNEYTQGLAHAQAGAAAANANAAYMAARNEYTQGLAHAQAAERATNANIAYMAGFNSFIPNKRQRV